MAGILPRNQVLEVEIEEDVPYNGIRTWITSSDIPKWWLRKTPSQEAYTN